MPQNSDPIEATVGRLFHLSNNSANQRREEELLFKAFLDVEPDFLNEAFEWSSAKMGYDPPDMVCVTASGRTIGVEICQWVHEKSMRDYRTKTRINESILNALGPQTLFPKPANFSLVFFQAKPKSRLTSGECAVFQRSFRDLISSVDRDLPARKGRAERPFVLANLKDYTPLNRHLEKVTFCPPSNELNVAVERALESTGGMLAPTGDTSGAVDWILPVGSTQWVRTPYDLDHWGPDDHGSTTVEGSLLKLLIKKSDRCSRAKLKTYCDELDLVIAFDQGLPCCPPTFDRRDTAREAVSRARGTVPWPFRRTHLLIAAEDSPTVHRILY